MDVPNGDMAQRQDREAAQAARRRGGAGRILSVLGGLRPGPKLAILAIGLASLFALFVLPIQTGPIELNPQGGSRSLRDPGAPLAIAEDEALLGEGLSGVSDNPPDPLNVDPATFLTIYEDSVVLDNVSSVCAAPAPDNAIHVATDGDDDNPGTEGAPLASIELAVQRAEAGQTVLVRGGEYRETVRIAEKYGTPDAYITIRSFPGERAKLIAGLGQDSFYFRRGNAYINIACFEMEGPTQLPEAQSDTPEEFRNRILNGLAGTDDTPQNYGVGVDIGDRADTRDGFPLNHHIRVIGNEIHDFAEGGISALESNHITVVGNRTYRNAMFGCHSGSGISLAYLQPGGGEDNRDGYTNYVVGNVSYENENISVQCFSDSLGPVITDGNGIIIDQNDLSGEYSGRTLIADNVVFDNGGRGIMVFESSGVDVVNNLSYNNIGTGNLLGRDGPHPEIAVSSETTDVRVYNNIAVPREGHIAFNDPGDQIDVRSNLFGDPGDELELFEPDLLASVRQFSLLPSATDISGGTPYLATPGDDGLPVTLEPVPIGPIYNEG